MTQYIKNTLGFLSCLILCVLVSCNEEDSAIVPISNGAEANYEWHSAKLNMSVRSDSMSRSAEELWHPNNNDLICVQFYQSNNSVVKGYAIYDSTSDVWNLNYQGILEKGKSLKCQVLYCANATISTETLNVSLNDQTPVFICDRAEYKAISDETVDLYAEMKPYCFRLRFKGSEACEFQYRGPFIYDSYSLNDELISAINSYYTILRGKLTATESNFYSPYYYCVADAMVAFRIKCDDKVFRYKQDLYRNKEFSKAGQSNTVLMPSVAPENWYVDDYWEWKTNDSYELPYSSNKTIFRGLHSKVGILVTFSYTITSLNSYVNENDYRFDLVFDAFDSNGALIKTTKYYIPNWIDDSIVGVKESACEYIFVDEADSYTVSIQTTGVKVTVTDFKVSTF